jgi:lon-related putative ATP-dependent protease
MHWADLVAWQSSFRHDANDRNEQRILRIIMPDLPVAPVPVAQLCKRCDIERFTFDTTADLPDIADIPGQARALEAIRFGADIRRPGYNLFVFGLPGTGKHGTVLQIFKEKAKDEPAPADWAYVNNFETPHKPIALSLPPSRGPDLKARMARLIEDIRTAVPTVFEGDDYQKRRQAIEDAFRERQEKAFEEVRQAAKERDVALIRTPMGFAFAPIRDGEVQDPDEFAKRPSEERKRIEDDIEALQQRLAAVVKQIPRWEKEHRDSIRTLNRETTAFTVGHEIDDISAAYADIPPVQEFLAAVRKDLTENFHSLLGLERVQESQIGELFGSVRQTGAFNRYSVNLIVGKGSNEGAPVVYEDNPTFSNLIGRVEHLAQMGALITDFTLIMAGALHRANGGYLVLDALKVLTQPMAWDALKRCLKAKQITIESLGQALSLVSTVSLEPQPIPLDVKVVLCGEPILYYLLCHLDPEFPNLFKVAAEFDDTMIREGSSEAYARLLATMVRRENLLPLDRTGVGRVIEHGARLADDAEKLTIRLETMGDVLREADFHARKAAARAISAAHVDKAIDGQIRRVDRLRERSIELIERGIVFIDTDGAAIGQVNGLSVLEIGGFSFGRPTRITTRVSLGVGKVIDIEREVELGGPIHSKGVLILSSLLASRFGKDVPLSLSASLVFEQSYGGVEGDSASAAEYFALLSAIAEVPLRQSLAVTGSINQHGSIQPIGGVNEKIEGFFDICQRRGLTGEQGVLIPSANVKHLMLRKNVVEACERGLFHVYSIEHADQGIALLTGVAAGDRGADGQFPAGTVHRKAEDRLRALANARRAFAVESKDEGKLK